MSYWIVGYIFLTLVMFYIFREITHNMICDGCDQSFLRRIRTDIWLSLPGRIGDRSRRTRARKYIRHYARMEGPRSHVLVTGVDKSFRNIMSESRYDEYQNVFSAPKWHFPAELVFCIFWVITFPVALIIVFGARVYYALS